MRQSTIQGIALGVAIALPLLSAIASPALALSISPQALSQINAALSFPNASQRFFNEGQQQLEREIEQLRDAPADASDPLLIDEDLPETLEQQRLQLEQSNGRSQDRTAPPQ
ncbi:hypothetical protein H6G89_09975 [Oscillatoria sp. FACHB-1407]|uniref:hypothetical protein n=1 Tax=Oscillatoria sp. FACHB-1407 TaxID=2692847 RepID=UPI001688B36C|nr:hypothetical protein [Oscillatoria sp. FACHB-1407]MBD2461374.1 hypothetical protein [Oscillatoria sp. FACHB-1407]